MSATVRELLAELKPLVKVDNGTIPVRLKQLAGLEDLTMLEVRSERAGMVDLCSDVRSRGPLSVAMLAYRLGYLMQRGGADWELLIYLHTVGAEDLAGIDLIDGAVVLSTDYEEPKHG